MPQERKLVTVLFADIVGSTTMVVSSDPEVARERLAGLFSRARAILVEHGATVEKFIGDAVMAVFGVPAGHEDDAERAARAALAVAGAFSAPGEGPFDRLEVRIGINTGEVAAGSGETDQFLVTGEPVNRAARLQAAAAPGEILAGALTRRLASGNVRFGPARAIQAKGLGEIEAWPVEGLASALPAGERTAAPSAAFVGRDRELALLGMLWSHATSSGRPYLVTLVGPAGIGKSRLVQEFTQTLGDAAVVATRCPPYGEGLALWPIEHVLAGVDPRSDLAGAFRRHLETLARDRPVALVVDDFHWAEPSFIDAIEHVVDRARGPILVLCAARGDLFTARASWGGGRPNAASLSLGPLPDDAIGKLAAAVSGERLPPAALSFILTHAEGNALFVQEYLRALRDGDPGALGSGVPPTLRALIAARLDRLPAATRDVLRLASVVGRTFDEEELAAIGADATRLRAALDDAERSEIVRLDPARGPNGRSFVHILFRDVAYAGSPKSDRIRQHDALSGWLETGPRPDLAVAAYHAEEAWRLSADLGAPATPPLATRAFDLLRRAAEDRRARTDTHAALALYRRALALAEAAGADAAATFEVRARAAFARLRIDGTAEAIAELDALLPEARRRGPTDLLVLLLVWRYSISLLDDAAEGRRLIDEAAGVADALGDAGRITYVQWASAELRAAAGDLDGQRRTLEAARDRMRAAGITYWFVPCLVDLADNALDRGDRPDADERSREALVESQAGVSAINRFRALEVAARIRLAAGDLQEATRYADAATVVARDIGEPWASARAALASAACLRAGGDVASARRLLEPAVTDAERVPRPTMRGVLTELRAALAVARIETGDRAGAETLTERARADAPRADARAARHLDAARRALDAPPADPLRA